MVPGYEEVLKRLQAERKRNHLLQSDLCRKLHMTQSHYSKVEIGKKRFTYDQLKKLNETDLDIHYIFTGNHVKLEHQRVFEGINASDWYFFGQSFYVILERLGNHQDNLRYKEIYDKNAAMKYILVSSRKNIWRQLREFMGYTQAEMAQHFEFDLKKYANLEKEDTFPDSESVYLLYEKFHIPPQVVLGDNRGVFRAVSDVMSELDSGDCEKIISCLELEWKLFH